MLPDRDRAAGDFSAEPEGLRRESAPSATPLAVFDIDGTLTDTKEVDDECYVRAVSAELGLPVSTDWEEFDEFTDAAILAETCQRSGRPVPDRDTQERIALRVAELLSAALDTAPDRFRPIPGATEVFEALRTAGWKVAIATGAWRPSALVKLRAAGIPHHGVPLASASDHPVRADIIEHAVRAVALEEAGPVVYIGDGVWDSRAARRLGYPFVGIARGSQAERLRKVGAVRILADFTNLDALLDCLSAATPSSA